MNGYNNEGAVVEAISAQVQKIQAEYQTFENSYDQTEAKIKQLDAKLNALKEKMNKLQGELKKLNAQLQKDEKQLKGCRTSAVARNDYIAQLEKSIISSKEKIKNKEDELSKAKEEVKSEKETINSQNKILKKQFNAEKKTLDALSKEFKIKESELNIAKLYEAIAKQGYNAIEDSYQKITNAKKIDKSRVLSSLKTAYESGKAGDDIIKIIDYLDTCFEKLHVPLCSAYIIAQEQNLSFDNTLLSKAIEKDDEKVIRAYHSYHEKYGAKLDRSLHAPVFFKKGISASFLQNVKTAIEARQQNKKEQQEQKQEKNDSLNNLYAVMHNNRNKIIANNVAIAVGITISIICFIISVVYAHKYNLGALLKNIVTKYYSALGLGGSFVGSSHNSNNIYYVDNSGVGLAIVIMFIMIAIVLIAPILADLIIITGIFGGALLAGYFVPYYLVCGISDLIIKGIDPPEPILKDTEGPNKESISNEVPSAEGKQGINQDEVTVQEEQQSAGNEESPVARNIDVSKVSPLQEQSRAWE